MEFTVDRDAFLKGLQLVQGAIENKRPSLPILANLFISPTSKGITLLGTDLDLELLATVEATILDIGSGTGMIVPARKCLEITRALPEGCALTLLEQEGKLIIRQGRGRFSLTTMPPQEYPLFEQEVVKVELVLKQSFLKEILDLTCFAMAQQDVRYYLNGVLLLFHAQGITAVATDGHRLALHELELSLGLKEDLRIIIPRKSILELLRLLQDSEETVELQVQERAFMVTARHFRFKTKMLEGKYPDHQRLLQNSGTVPALILREPFKQMLQRVSALLMDRNRGALFSFSENCLMIRAVNSDKDEVEEQLEIEYQGPPIEIGFNLSYLLEYLSLLKTKTVQLYLSDPHTSLRMCSVEDHRGQYIVMPMRL